MFVGKASFEGEVLDSATGERLGAGADRRSGTNIPIGVARTWDDVENAYDTWAKKLRKRLADLRDRDLAGSHVERFGNPDPVRGHEEH